MFYRSEIGSMAEQVPCDSVALLLSVEVVEPGRNVRGKRRLNLDAGVYSVAYSSPTSFTMSSQQCFLSCLSQDN